MRGYLQPAKKNSPSEAQTAFAGLPRGRRSKLAAAAQTTLVKADQWARGESVDAALNEALERSHGEHQKKAAKAKK
ncbi:MAG TPA: hypothetical protein VF407_03620 [Polyangiaceae bacterium]